MGRPLKGSVEKKGKRWYFRLYLRSKRRYEAAVPPRPSGQPIDRAYAERYAADRAEKYRQGVWDPEVPATAAELAQAQTVAEYGAAWFAALTHANKASDQRWWDNFIAPPPLGAKRLDEVTRQDVREFVEGLKRTKAKRGEGTIAARSVRNIYSVLRRMFEHAEDAERIDRTPCRLKRNTLPVIVDKNPLARRDWIRAPEHVVQLLTDPRIPPDRRVLYALEFLSGARFGEVAVLRWTDWSPDLKPLGRLSVARSRCHATGAEKGTKTGVPREVPVHPWLAQILTAWRDGGWEAHYKRARKADDFIVPSRRKVPRGVKSSWMRHREDGDLLGLPRVRQHDARRTFISLAIAGGARPDVLEWLTHDVSKKRIVNQYTTLPWATLCEAVTCLRLGPCRESS